MNIEKTNVQLINEKHETAAGNADQSKTYAHAAVIAAWECGQLLNAEKTKILHGEWLQWLETNCPNITPRTAQRYMDHGRKYDSVSHLVDAMNAKALMTVGILSEPENKGGADVGTTIPKPDPGLLYLQRFCQYQNQHDLTKLNDVGRQVWKKRLEPIVELYNKL